MGKRPVLVKTVVVIAAVIIAQVTGIIICKYGYEILGLVIATISASAWLAEAMSGELAFRLQVEENQLKWQKLGLI